MPTDRPGYYTDDNGRFRLWRPWGTLKLSPKHSLEICAGFTPIPNYQNSRILGTGWSFPILESTLLAINEREYELKFPTGHRMKLYKTKNPNLIKNSTWKGSISNKITTVQSSCGWTLLFDNGRLKRIKTPENIIAEFHQNKTGTLWITINGKTALLLKNEIDPVTTRRIAHLTLQDKRHALLKFAYRPAIIEILEKTSNGKTQKTQRNQRVETLSSIQWDGQPAEHYNFTADTLNITGGTPYVKSEEHPFKESSSFRWRPSDCFLEEEDGTIHSFVTIKGIRCSKSVSPDGKTYIHGKDDRRNINISQSEGKNIIIDEYMPDMPRSNLPPQHKSRTEILPDGTEILLFRYWYDENREIIRHQFRKDGKPVLWQRLKNGERLRDPRTNTILWEKTHDSQNRVIKIIADDKTYEFEYSKNGKEVTLTQYHLGKKTKSLTLPETQLKSLLLL